MRFKKCVLAPNIDDLKPQIFLFQDDCQQHTSQQEDSSHDNELIDILISSGKETFKITTYRHDKFLSVATSICEEADWDQKKTRFLLNGSRIQNNKTFSENDIENHAQIDVMFEMVGGKGPSEAEIREMLEKEDTGSEDESDELDESSDISGVGKEDRGYPDSNKRLYDELKMKLMQGSLELDRSKAIDEKLLFLLDTDSLNPYELLRLRNVYGLWELLNGGSAKEPMRTSHKRTSEKVLEESDETTPVKRKRLLQTMELNTPSPLKKNVHIDEREMKSLSVAVHLWSERKMGGTQFLQKVRLDDIHFRDILNFTGPNSRWKIMRNRTIAELRSLWRNNFGGKHYYRGDRKTGFENHQQRHSPSSRFCPFGHCRSGLMSPMDLDLILLTPTKSIQNEKDVKIPKSSRQLFEDEVNLDVNNQSTLNQELSSKSLTSDIISEVESCVSRIVDLNDENSKDDQKEEHRLQEQDIISELESCKPSAVDLNDENPKDDQMEESGHQEQVILSHDNIGEEKDVIGMNFACNIDQCEKNFQTLFGLERHTLIKHSIAKHQKEESTCQLCNKKVIYLDQHMRTIHGNIHKSKTCEVCQVDVSLNMQKHRKVCIKCRYCEYTNSNKARLIKHINKCSRGLASPPHEAQYDKPLDLRSPFKIRQSTPNAEDADHESITVRTKVSDVTEELNNGPACTFKGKDVSNLPLAGQNIVSTEAETLERGRHKYPFDIHTLDEDYYSEIDIDDQDQFTISRRKNKDQLELKLRDIDGLQNEEICGDNFIVEKFEEFMRNKQGKQKNEGDFSKQTEPRTITLYTDVLEKDILKAIHKLVKPFDARWLIDAKTPKICKIEGEERSHVKPEEPIYLTSIILEEALKRHDANGNSGNQKKMILAALKQLMAFIEMHFTLKLSVCGPEVLGKVQTYHLALKNYISGASLWKKNKDEEIEGFEKNKLLNDYENPNKDAAVLEKYKEYITSDERIAKITKILEYSHPDAVKPNPSLMTEFGIDVMEEIVACTGCRPKVSRHLTMGAFIDAKPGFNPYNTNKEDSTLEEDHAGDKIYRRLNPNLPPKEKACVHQIEGKTATCSVKCDQECIPDGYNIWVTWDKTQSSKGPYYLHIPTPIKNLMNLYDIIRSNYFQNKRPKISTSSSWLEDPKTPFFLNSACGSFPSLNLKRLSAILEIDVTAYSFRKIVSTWAMTHKCEEIRKAEEEALQHSEHVAKDRYHQGKQVQPQTLTQTYVHEENIFPENLRRELDTHKSDIEKSVVRKQEERSKMRYSNLNKEKILSKKSKYENRPLGPRTAILERDRKKFAKVFQEVTGNALHDLLATLKPIQFRDFVVRVVCSATGENGDELREIWSSFYRGDLRFGIRDMRRQAKEKNWPQRKQNPGRQDRNSWIAHNLRKSCQEIQKFEKT